MTRKYKIVWIARELVERAYFLDLLDTGEDDDARIVAQINVGDGEPAAEYGGAVFFVLCPTRLFF